jgi:Mg-chelatase subunit ChlI
MVAFRLSQAFDDCGVLMSTDLRQDVFSIIDFISDNLYLNRPDLEVGDRDYNAALLMSVLTGLIGGKALIVGEPGLGKTTSAEYVGSLLYRVPLGTVWEAEVSGHPEQTEEKIVGRPDLGKLNQGNEDVVWSGFAVLPIKIVDEINRLPETKQSLILTGVDRGHWTYLNQMVVNDEYALFATANYQDRGTNTIVPPLMDRFDVMVESKHPGPNLAWMIGTGESMQDRLRDPEREEAIQQILAEDNRLDQLDEMLEGYGRDLTASLGVPTFGWSERESVREAAGAIPFDSDANGLMRTFLAELTFCCKFGQKRSNEVCDEGCHYKGYLSYEVRGCVSNRFPVSVRRYAQALAWLNGRKTVDVEHLRTILPYAAAHRINWRDDVTRIEETDSRTECYPIHRARDAMKQVVRRYSEQSDRIKSALGTASRIFDGEALEPVDGEHPLYREIFRDLGVDDSKGVRDSKGIGDSKGARDSKGVG